MNGVCVTCPSGAKQDSLNISQCDCTVAAKFILIGSNAYCLCTAAGQTFYQNACVACAFTQDTTTGICKCTDYTMDWLLNHACTSKFSCWGNQYVNSNSICTDCSVDSSHTVDMKSCVCYNVYKTFDIATTTCACPTGTTEVTKDGNTGCKCAAANETVF